MATITIDNIEYDTDTFSTEAKTNYKASSLWTANWPD